MVWFEKEVFGLVWSLLILRMLRWLLLFVVDVVFVGGHGLSVCLCAGDE